MPMHVSRSLRLSKGYRPGHETVPRKSMTASRQPIRPVSAPRSVVELRATPVPLRHPIPRGGGCFFSLHAHDVPPFSIAGSPAVAGPSPPAGIGMPPMPHRHAPACFSREENHFLHGPRHGALRRLPMPATPVPPRRIAMRCSRGGTRGLSHGLEV